MGYKISGTSSSAANLIILKESDNSIDVSEAISAGAYEYDVSDNEARVIIAYSSQNGAIAYNNVTPSYSVIGDLMVIGGGNTASTSYVNTIETITISSLGNASDFGDLTLARRFLAAASNGDEGRGLFAGGATGSAQVTTDYVAIATPGNATNFGNLSQARESFSGTSNGSSNRAVFGGGSPYSATRYNTIDYFTVSTTGNASDFGDLLIERKDAAACSNGTNNRGVWSGGNSAGNVKRNEIDYVTITTPANAQDFGDLSVANWRAAGTSTLTNNIGVFGGGNSTSTIVDKITITSTGNATNFGSLTVGREYLSAATDGSTGIWAGGQNGATRQNTIDYLLISAGGAATDFGDLSEARRDLAASSNAG
jgi:hypothetical protein